MKKNCITWTCPYCRQTHKFSTISDLKKEIRKHRREYKKTQTKVERKLKAEIIENIKKAKKIMEAEKT